MKILAESLPDAWKHTLLDQKFAEKNPQLKKIRDGVLDRIADGAASIDREDFPNDQEYQRALLRNFTDISGVSFDSTRELQTLLETLKKQKEEGKSTPEVEKIM